MPYTLFECNKSNRMNMIWDDIWLETTIESQLRKIEGDELLPIFLRYLPPKGKIIEAGCGLGKWVICLKRKGFDIIGIDFAKEALQQVKRYDMSIPVEFGDITRIEYSDNYFDAYISLGVVEHFEEGPFLALKEAKRILKPGGLIFVSIPIFSIVRHITLPIEKSLCFFRENRYIRRLFRKENYPNKYFFEYRFKIKEFTDILIHSGFQIEIIIPHYHYWFGLTNLFLEPLPFFRNQLIIKVTQNLANQIKKISPWLSPHMVMWIGRKL